MLPENSIPMRPITGRHSLAPRSHTRTGISLPHGSLSRKRDPGPVRAYHVPHQKHASDEGPCYTPARNCSQRGSIEEGVHHPLPSAEGSSLEPQLWLVEVNDAYASSLMLSLCALTVAPHCLLLADSASPRGLAYRSRRVRFRKLHTWELPPTHVPVGSAG